MDGHLINGVDSARLKETVNAISEDFNLATFKFSIKNKWKGGSVNCSTINEFFGGQTENKREEDFKLCSDEPEMLLGKDSAVNPVEYLLHALASCVTTSTVYHAAYKGIKIKSITSIVEGDIDLRGFLGLDENISPGYLEIRMLFKLVADDPDIDPLSLCQIGAKYSPVYNTVTRGVPVKIMLDED